MGCRWRRCVLSKSGSGKDAEGGLPLRWVGRLMVAVADEAGERAATGLLDGETDGDGSDLAAGLRIVAGSSGDGATTLEDGAGGVAGLFALAAGATIWCGRCPILHGADGMQMGLDYCRRWRSCWRKGRWMEEELAGWIGLLVVGWRRRWAMILPFLGS
ncbi:hypothetical protein ACLOJK_023507 [Asimina triloba]